jgi:hypothetical protein
MEDKIIEHLSNEIQKVIETTMTFRTRIAFVAWIGPFVLFSSLVVATKGRFHFPTGDWKFFWIPLAVFCVCYVFLGWLGARIEKEAWKRCDYLRQRIIMYSKRESLTDISDTDLNHPAMVKRIISAYILACTLILISLFSVSIAFSRIEPKGSELTQKSTVTEKQMSPAPAPPPSLEQNAGVPSPEQQHNGR